MNQSILQSESATLSRRSTLESAHEKEKSKLFFAKLVKTDSSADIQSVGKFFVQVTC